MSWRPHSLPSLVHARVLLVVNHWFSDAASSPLYNEVETRLFHHSSFDMPRVKRSCDGPKDGLGVIHNMQFCTDSPRELEGFDATVAINDMFPLEDLPPPPKGDLETTHSCPLCSHVLQYDEVTTSKGDTWCYYRCPSVTDYTKCFVASAADQLESYLDRVANTLHPCYKRGVDAYEPSMMRCYCNKSLILAMSKSQRNSMRLYFKCPKGSCSFFQWGDEAPLGKIRRWLHQGVDPNAKGKEQNHKPYDLAAPIQRTRPYEVTPRC